jgi:hypothetical protein
MKRLASILFWFFTATAICSAETLYYPQIVNGQQGGGVSWVTWIFINNPSPVTATGSMQFIQDNGTPFNISFINVDTGQPVTIGNILPFDDGAGQTHVYLSTGGGPLLQGFGTLSTAVRVTSTAVFSKYAYGGGPGTPGGLTFGLVAEAGVPTVTPSVRQAIFFYTANNFDTGLALVNPDTSAANITLQLYDRNAVALAPPLLITIPANNHIAKFVSQLFPSAVGFDGTLLIISPTPLAAVSLRFSASGAITTLPVISMASLLNPALQWIDHRPWLAPINSLARLINALQFTIG